MARYMPELNSTRAGGVGGAPARWGRAVVIGGGFAGLVTARVLADFFADVVILEQDEVDPDAGVHPHVPQGRHAHGLLARGGQILERYFPGLGAELEAAGAPVFDYGEGAHFLLPQGYARRARTGVRLQTVTRDALERALRRRVLSLPQVTQRDGVRCLGLTARSPGRVTGVLHGLRDEVDADFVVDASGRSSTLTEWLARLRVTVPPARVVKAKVSYTSVGFDRSADDADFLLTYQMTFAPDVPRGGVILAVEGNRWLCSLIGYDEHVPPTDPAGYLEFARSLKNTTLFELLERRRGQDAVRRYTNLTNEWNQFHRALDWPERLVAVGDSVCVLNPVYGQGLTLAAMHAELLHRMLSARASRGTRADGTGGLDGLSRAFHRELVRVIRPAWALSSGSDLMWNPRRAPLSVKITHWYNCRIFAAATRDDEVWARFARVVNMLAPPTTLFAPKILARTLLPRRRRG